MSSTRLKAFGLSFLAMLGLTAFGAAGAQAEFLVFHPGATFAQVGLGHELEQGQPLTFKGLQLGVSRFIIPGRKVEISCGHSNITEGKAYGLVLHATFLFSNCLAHAINPMAGHQYPLMESNALQNCVIEGHNGQGDGTIQIKVKAVPKLHNGETFLLFSSLTAETPLTVIKFLPNENCNLPPMAPLKGSFVGIINQLNVAAQLLSFSTGITLLFQQDGLPGDKLQHGMVETYFTGHYVELLTTGPAGFVGVPWGAH